MKEIKLNYIGYPLRGAINRAIVYNETELVFKNGIAVAKAEIQENVGGQYSTYECIGLINEQFEEHLVIPITVKELKNTMEKRLQSAI